MSKNYKAGGILLPGFNLYFKTIGIKWHDSEYIDILNVGLE
jgi:hypothetical protein